MKTIKKLREMNIPHMQLGGIVTIKETTAQKDIDIVNEYLHNFIEPNGKCIKCENDLGGFLGTFNWGITWGEGYCGKCNYPVRAHHSIKDKEDNEVVGITNFLLQYHPDLLEEK